MGLWNSPALGIMCLALALAEAERKVLLNEGRRVQIFQLVLCLDNALGVVGIIIKRPT